MADLWRKLLAKTRGSVRVLAKLGDINRQVRLHGSTKKNEEIDKLEKLEPLPFILMPES